MYQVVQIRNFFKSFLSKLFTIILEDLENIDKVFLCPFQTT
ncbi:hypothetical protein RIEPE_0093 [Candidatus Riesia pediculicola USDA]|uniref:Uncharacterized protein n=1 Tax=Riesia pediculicola (strain USDA) TaxID=515618 RepID=D4G7Q4_RIEPU|nr:hypothetical protein RIEPE_0093 [Candidatus Riesia pediculicola USDA]